MSAPAAKAFSEPVMTMQPMPASASKPSSAWFSSPTSVELSAFSACGRLRVIEPDLAARLDEDGLVSHARVSSSLDATPVGEAGKPGKRQSGAEAFALGRGAQRFWQTGQ